MPYTRLDLCAALYAPEHLTEQNIADRYETTTDAVSSFYGELARHGLVDLLDGTTSPPALRTWEPLVLSPMRTPAILIEQAVAKGVDVSSPLPRVAADVR
jgi:hypothetical protein